ncbi:hypothetical protein FRB94_009288 [Tulasnella sp. JGI-2019a]|nr:hypothetical protein FRB94_009288 [Tulasnella sp. JGI-2019a]
MVSLHSSSSDGEDQTIDEKSGPAVNDKNSFIGKTANLTLDQGTELVRYRRKWYQLHLPRNLPPPPPATLDDAEEIPLAQANIMSQLTYSWITPIITLGYQRPLQALDLWKLDASRKAEFLSKKLDASWKRRCERAEEWNAKLDSGETKAPVMKRIKWTLQSLGRQGPYEVRERRWRKIDGRQEPNLAWALNEVLGRSFWIGGFFKVIGDTAQLMCPLLSKDIITFAQQRANGESHAHIGKGVGLAIGLFLMSIVASICQHQFYWRSMQTGVLARATLISSIYKRGLTLTPKSRARHSNAALMNHMSTDISRVDFAAQCIHAAWTAPIQVAICLALLIAQLGPSALAGFAVFIILTPVQKRMMGIQLKVRGQSMKHTDERASILQELLGGMRIIKYFCYERPFLGRIQKVRKQELVGIWWISIIKAANMATALSVPVLASVLAFVVYSLSGHDQNPAIIFTSLGFFQLLRQPLMIFPRALGATTDAKNAFSRLTPVWKAETFAPSTDGTSSSTIHIDPSSPYAIHVENADFQWEEPPLPPPSKTLKKNKVNKTAPPTPTTQEPFSIQDISMSIPKKDKDREGQVWAVVGPVGSGKSSLLQAMIGEMKQTGGNGKVVFGGKVAYCAQVAWIQNASVRENILFGVDWDEERYWRAVRDAALMMDLEILPNGDLTEIGEKGINLSGGQKQRVNIARALYADADIVILDDPLSAVDAHVGEALFTNAILSACRSKGKTVLLVTHALHFLPRVDYILHVVSGKIVEQGTYHQLVNANGGNGAFARLTTEFSIDIQRAEGDADMEGETQVEAAKVKAATKMSVEEVKRKVGEKIGGKAAGTGKIEGRLMKAEKRSIGSIQTSGPYESPPRLVQISTLNPRRFAVYSTYIKAGNGWWTMPLIILAGVLMQASQVLSSYWLIWWQANTFHHGSAFYMGVYAALGVGQAIFTFLLGVSMALLSFYACVGLHHQALGKVFHAPMSFFDTTPLGRILGVFGKDIDAIDNQLADSLRMTSLILASALGSVVIITVLLHYFIVVIAVLLLGYWYFVAYYRESARELKRLDGSLRSLLYGHFSESLGGLTTIRAYGSVARFFRDNEYFMDLENRALFLTTTNQRWLAIRLDFMGSILLFVVAIMAAAGTNSINPAQIGLALTYCTSLTQILGGVTMQFAEVENNMNAVERIVHYTRDDFIEQEAAYEVPETKPLADWPQGGSLQFRDVVMRYRPNLPPVLHGISLDIREGEKIGVVGRTGAGKSSLMIALYRVVELSGGSIWLDGIDISTLGLFDLRSKISIIPQDPLLFSGTIRSNLDPFSRLEDAKLYDALRRAHLVTAPPSTARPSGEADGEDSSPKGLAVNRFTLETPIEPEGANLSVGERSLLSLARALVRDEIKLVVMDEATASVDMETDAAIQQTISKEFGGKTLLCIAHRLRTIIHYDRVLVLEQGRVAEFDTPLNLFRQDGSIFRSLCDQSKITEEELIS